MVEIFKNGKRVAKSQNLRGIKSYASKHGMEVANVLQVTDSEGFTTAAIVTFLFADGAWAHVPFNSFQIACEWVSKRANRYWFCAWNKNEA